MNLQRTDTESLPFAPILDLMICPKCSGRLEASAEQLACGSCQATFPVRNGIPLLALMGASLEYKQEGNPQCPTEDYEQQYQSVDQATEYNSAYKEKLFKRMSTAKEFRLLNQLLGSQGQSDIILDLPCGGGRLSPQIGPFTKLLVEADIGEGQVLYCKQNSVVDTPQVFLTASGFNIPFADGSVDGAVCCRLSHHLVTVEEREHLVKELLRVSRRFVIMTFFDYHSVKNTLRRWRQPFDGKPAKMTLTVDKVRELAKANGARLVQYPTLAALSSGHRYALMVKE